MNVEMATPYDQGSSKRGPIDSLATPPAVGRRADDPKSKSRTAWLKSKTKNVFSSSSSSRPPALATSNDMESSHDEAASHLPLRGGALQTLTASNEPIEVKSVETKPEPSIFELWDEAYEELRKKDKALVEKYEAELSKNMVEMDILAAQQSAVAFSGLGKEQKYQQMKTLIDRKTEQIEKGTWKAKFRDHELSVKDLVVPVVGVVQWAKDYVGTALHTSPSGSLAWAGVCLLLPLVLNPTNQEAARVKALDEISNILAQCFIRESLYHHRYERNGNYDTKKELASSHVGYRDALRALYVEILSFQATNVFFFSKDSFMRFGEEIMKWNAWDTMLADIKSKEVVMMSLEKQWSDTRLQEECDLLKQRHDQQVENLEAIQKEVSRLRDVVLRVRTDHQRKELLAWLCSIKPSTNYNAARRRHEPSTGDWLVTTNKNFKRWQEEPNSLLWLHGKAGAGKSFLSSSIIDHLTKSHDSDPYTALAYFYFSFQDKKKQNTVNMLRSLIVQLCGRRPDTPKSVQDLARYKDINQEPGLKELENTLRSTTEDFKDVYLVIDGIDECPLKDHERADLLKVLQRMKGWSLANLHVLLTSRKENDIEAELELLLNLPATSFIDLQIHDEEVNRDIGIFIDQRIASSAFRSWPCRLKEDVKATLTQKSDGMFQYVSLQLDALMDAKSLDAVQRALENLSEGLDKTYSQILLRLEPNARNQALGALKWLAFSARPLELIELSEAAIVDPTKTPAFNESNRFFASRDIKTILSGLVIVEVEFILKRSIGLPFRNSRPSLLAAEASGQVLGVEGPNNPWASRYIVRLAHFSVKEYLMSDRIKIGASSVVEFCITEAACHTHIAESCLYYHLYVCQILPTIASMEEGKEAAKRFPLWQYAAEYWATHMEAVPSDHWSSSLTGLARRVLRPRSNALLMMIRVSRPHVSLTSGSSYNWSFNPSELGAPLYYIAMKGCLQYVILAFGK